MPLGEGFELLESALLKSGSLHFLQEALLEKRPIAVESLWSSSKAFFLSYIQKISGKHLLVITPSNQEELHLFHDLSFFTERQVLTFPAWETLPNENVAPSPDIVGERYHVLESLIHTKEPLVILAGLQAILQKVLPPKSLDSLFLELKVGLEFPFDGFIQKLVEMGYKRVPLVSDKAEFAVRGGIIDIFAVSSIEPYRIEFWGDEITSIRSFDPIGQKSVLPLDKIELTAGTELELLNDSPEKATIFDYFGEDLLIVLDDVVALEDRYVQLMKGFETPSSSFLSLKEFIEKIKSTPHCFFSEEPFHKLQENPQYSQTPQGYSKRSALIPFSFEIFDLSWDAWRWNHPFLKLHDLLGVEDDGALILQALSSTRASTSHVYFITASETEKNHLIKIVEERQLHARTSFLSGYLSEGVGLMEEGVLLFPYTELSNKYRLRRQKQRATYHTLTQEFYELLPGDIIVHLQHGIGKFLGIEKKPNAQGQDTEFLVLEYAEGGKLYVPLNQSHLVTKYIGSDEAAPKFHQLGGSRWKHTKEKTEKEIRAYAKDIIRLYAERQWRGGFAFSADSPDTQAFEDEFPYEETEDQLRAIEALKQDMQNVKAMDRLVCGDVGYGKTEVAMRAAFKAVMDGGKQVAVLVPTTILAMQHYENFCERMAGFPVEIAVLSRFLSPKEVKVNLKRIESGRVDIVVGTHRLISKDVIFPRLGLIIIDEEQRFGVKAKEHLKAIKVGVDCLTLSATPIPRTLYMSLMGARDLSVINTPPHDRLPIKSIIAQNTDELIRSALLRELNRDGQAYFIHNRVETIFEAAAKIKQLLPDARVGVAHGQMNEEEIDRVFHQFKQGHLDVLVATTIVENGIDIPNANTILIDNADKFGMADLYQLRGRVGRWNRRAFCYFMVKNPQRLPEISRKRLEALLESSGYGGGMRVAMRDLEIRGAGHVLGTEQSGHASVIGFQLYCKLLKDAIREFQGEKLKDMVECKVDIPQDARLPEYYVNDLSLRMDLYRRLGEAISIEEVDELWKEIQDRFGTPPLEAEWLYRLTRLKVFGSLNYYSKITVDKMGITFEKSKAGQTTVYKKLLPKYSSPESFEKAVLKLLEGK